MPAILGRDVRLLYYATADFTGSPVAVLSAKTVGFSGTSGSVDITDMSSGAWRELMDEVGEKSAEVSFAGILKDSTLKALYDAQGTGTSLHSFGLDYPGYGEYRGKFFISDFSLGAEVGPNAVTAECTLQSSGAIAWVPE